jgi:Concanavalin A-like lectin/glucanases superfamily
MGSGGYNSRVEAGIPALYDFHLDEASGPAIDSVQGAVLDPFGGVVYRLPGALPDDGSDFSVGLTGAYFSGSPIDAGGSGNFSVEIWARIDSPANNPLAEHGWRVEVGTSGTITFTCSGVGPFFDSVSAPPDSFLWNQMNYIVCTFEGGAATIYANGEVVGGDTVSPDMIISNVFEIGHNSDTLATMDSGRVARVTEYEGVLDADEVALRGRAGGIIPVAEVPGANGVGYILDARSVTPVNVDATVAPDVIIAGESFGLIEEVPCWAEFFSPQVVGTDLLTLTLWNHETEVGQMAVTRADADAVFARAPITLSVSGSHILSVRGVVDSGSVEVRGGDGSPGELPPISLWVYPIGSRSQFVED